MDTTTTAEVNNKPADVRDVRQTSNWTKGLLGILLVILIAALAFFVGWRIQRFQALRNGALSRRPALFGRMMQPFGNGALRRRGRALGLRSGAGGLSGQVSNVNGNQLQVTLPNGQTLNVTLNTGTAYSQVSSATQQSLRAGENVTIFGTRTANSSVSAQSVRINTP